MDWIDEALVAARAGGRAHLRQAPTWNTFNALMGNSEGNCRTVYVLHGCLLAQDIPSRDALCQTYTPIMCEIRAIFNLVPPERREKCVTGSQQAFIRKNKLVMDPAKSTTAQRPQLLC